ncbi:unnamed protein product, partial [Symbiodinium sp. CCMP2456]
DGSRLWNVSRGSCELHDDGCITSPGYSGTTSGLEGDGRCTIQVRPSNSWRIRVETFQVHPYFSTFTINGVNYATDRSPSDLNYVVPQGKIDWRPDEVTETQRWKLCLEPPPRLESCRLAAVLRQTELAISGFDIIAEGAFDPLGCRLRRLSLTNNTFTSLPPQRFRCLSCLQALDLGKGQLVTLEDGTFEGLEELRLLSLSQNRLRNLSVGVLRPLVKLEQLLLGGNERTRGNYLTSLPDVSHNLHLQVLDVSENQ